MAAGTKEAAGRLRTEAGYRRNCNEEGTIFNMPNYHVTESAPIVFGMGGMDIYADMPAYGLSDKPAGLIDPQSS